MGDVETVDRDRELAEDSPGLPGLRTWTAVYVTVVAIFILWDLVLTALSLAFA